MADLTDWQIANLFFRAADPDKAKDGVYWPVPDVRVPRPWEDPPPTWVSYEEMYKGRLRAFGMFTPEEIEDRWQAFLAANPSYLLTQDQFSEEDYRVGTQGPGDPGSGAQRL